MSSDMYREQEAAAQCCVTPQPRQVSFAEGALTKALDRMLIRDTEIATLERKLREVDDEIGMKARALANASKVITDMDKATIKLTQERDFARKEAAEASAELVKTLEKYEYVRKSLAAAEEQIERLATVRRALKAGDSVTFQGHEFIVRNTAGQPVLALRGSGNTHVDCTQSRVVSTFARGEVVLWDGWKSIVLHASPLLEPLRYEIRVIDPAVPDFDKTFTVYATSLRRA